MSGVAPLVIAWSFICSSYAQTPDSATQRAQRPETSDRSLVIGGELGAFGELYGTSGPEKRRPSSTGRLYLRSNVTAWQSISASINMMISTEGSSTRQSINQMDFNPRWRWGEAHLGDFFEEYTPFTLSGVRVRGGALTVTPGELRFSLLSGATRRAVTTADNNRSYERLVSGGRIGFGRANGSTIDLYAFTARDRLSSLAAPPDSAGPFTDSLAFEGDQQPQSITPQENLVISAAAQLVMFRSKVKWSGEVAGCAITRDRRSAEMESSDVPEFVKDIFTPRVSTSADYAHTTKLTLELRKVSLSAGYKYIGPGYVSLGLASLLADRREISGGATMRYTGGMARFDGAFQHDNLIHQKRYTTDRVRLSTIITYRLTKQWNTNVSVAYTGMANDAPAGPSLVDFASWTVRSGHSFNYAREIGLRSMTLDITYQSSRERNPLRTGTGMTSAASTIGGTVTLRHNLEVVSSVGVITSRIGSQSRVFTQTYSISGRHASVERKLATSLSAVVTVGDVTTVLRPTLKADYQLSDRLSMTVEIGSAHVMGGPETGRFNEGSGSLNLVRGF